MENPWTTNSIDVKYDNGWIRVEEHKVINPSGNNGIYGKVCFKNRAVGIIPVDRYGYTWLVGQYRYTLDDYSWEIPMGGCPENEEMEDAAKRELREETGLVAKKLTKVMDIHTSNSITDEEGIVYLAEKLTEGTPDFDETEEIAIKHIPFLEVVNMVINGQITDAISVAAILKVAYQNMIKRKFDILYQDNYCCIVNKPAGLLVHRTAMCKDKEFLLQHVRDQIDATLYPVHRLDRPTSGLVLFSIDKEQTSKFATLFSGRDITKTYVALVRGYTDDSGEIDYALKNKKKDGEEQSAFTSYETLKTVEVPIPVGPYECSRYSLVKVTPRSGRMHQIRKHFAHLRHPLIGDTSYGDTNHNKMFKQKFHLHRLMLMAVKLEFDHPVTSEAISVKASLDRDFTTTLKRLGMVQSQQELDQLMDF